MKTILLTVFELTPDNLLDHCVKELEKIKIKATIVRTGFFKRALQVEVHATMDDDEILSLGALIGTLLKS